MNTQQICRGLLFNTVVFLREELWTLCLGSRKPLKHYVNAVARLETCLCGNVCMLTYMTLKYILSCVCICRWCGRQTGSENKLQHSAGWAVWPRPGQLGMCVLRCYSVLCFRTGWDRRQRGDAVFSVMGRPVFLHTVSLGEVQHWDFVPALGLRHQSSGNLLPKDKLMKRKCFFIKY